jgi:hypothetical protein
MGYSVNRQSKIVSIIGIVLLCFVAWRSSLYAFPQFSFELFTGKAVPSSIKVVEYFEEFNGEKFLKKNRNWILIGDARQLENLARQMNLQLSSCYTLEDGSLSTLAFEALKLHSSGRQLKSRDDLTAGFSSTHNYLPNFMHIFSQSDVAILVLNNERHSEIKHDCFEFSCPRDEKSTLLEPE